MKCLGSGLSIEPKNIILNKQNDEYSFMINSYIRQLHSEKMNLYNIDLDNNHCYSVCNRGDIKYLKTLKVYL